MACTATISLTAWNDVVSRTTGNPSAEDDILAKARHGVLLVEKEGDLFAPMEQKSRWDLEQVLTEDAIADLLGIPYYEVHRLLIEAQVPIFGAREQMFFAQNLWRRTDIEQRLEAFTAEQGLTSREAALELGLTLSSYEPLIPKVMFNSNGRVLKVLLEAYRNKFLPRNKSWSTRSSLVNEFVDNFNRKNPSSPIVVQPCDVDNCDHIASAQCENPKCRGANPPRFVCPAHEKWIDVDDLRRRPPALCPSCASDVGSGKLRGFSLL